MANLLLYIPLGFLSVAWAQGRGERSAVHGVAALIVVGAVAVGVEYAQIFFAPRTVSMNDILAELIGTAIGVSLWYAAGHRLEHLVGEALGSGTRAIRAAIVLYLVAYVALAIFPFDFLVSVAELREKAASDTWGLLLAPAACDGVVRCALRLFADVMAATPLGVLVALGPQTPGRDAWRRAAGYGLALGLIVEALQLLTASGIGQGMSVVARSAGAALGAWLVGHVARWVGRPVPAWIRSGALLAAPPYAALVAGLNGWFSGPWLAWPEAVGKLKGTMFLPFYFHYFTTETAAMQSLVANALMYAPVGVGWWLHSAHRARAGAGVPVTLAVALAAIVEAGKLFVAGKHPDPTNVLIAGAAAALAFTAARWAAGALPRALASTGTASPAHAPGSTEPATSADVRADRGAPLLEQVRAAILGTTPIPAPATAADRLSFLGGVALLVVAALILVRFPVGQIWLGAGLLAYAVALRRNPSLWLIVVPALLPSLSLAPLSGWYFVDELDLFLLVTIGVALLRPAAGVARVPLPRTAVVLISLLAVSYAVSTLRGLLPLSPLDLNALSSYYSSFESLRLAKGFFWALLLLPAMQRAFVEPERAGRFLLVGMMIGLLAAGTAVAWERFVFTGLFDLSTDFRATGTFAGMNTGGNEIESYFVMALPFAVLWLAQSRSWLSVMVGVLALVLGSYALLLTFARGGYVAGAIGVVLATVGVLVARRADSRSHLSWGRAAGIAAAIVVVALLGVAVATAPYMADRFAGTAGDLRTRWNHWWDSVAMMDDGIATSLFGMGIGRFPETYFWKTRKGDRPGTYAYVEEEGNVFLRLGAGDPLYLRQRIAVEGGTKYQLGLDLRSDQPGGQLTVYLCEQTPLYSARCKAQTFTARQAERGWQSFEATFASGEVGSGDWYRKRPVYLGLNYRTGETAIDVDNVRLLSPAGENLVRNGRFEDGFDHWLFAVDDHLPWHIKNLWLTFYFEQGWLGVAVFSAVLLWGAVVMIRPLAKEWSLLPATFAAVVALVVGGFVDNPFDFPRISTVFYLTLFSGLIQSSIRRLPMS